MKGLLIKDFHLMKMQKNYFLLILMISLAFIFSSKGNQGALSYAIGFFCITGTLFAMSTVSYDEFDNGNPFLFSLPFTRKTYVLEKYCFGLIVGIGFWLLCTLLSVFFLVFNKLPFTGERVGSFLLLVPLFLVLLSVMLPFTLKYGGEKSRLMIIGFVGGILLLGFLLSSAIRLLNLDLSSFLSFLSTLDYRVLLAGILAAACLILLCSLKLSISIVRKKEF